MRRSLLATLLWLFLSTPAWAALARPVSVEALARGADAVVQGRVERRESRWAADGRHIYTDVTVHTQSVWRGDAPERVVVQVPGGEVGDVGQRVDAAATFSEGEQVVIFLSRAGGQWRVHGMGLGKFRVEAGQARPSLSGLSVVKGQVAPGERLVGAMSVEELERRVRAVR